MKTQSITKQSFNGKIICGPGLEGTRHFLTKRVRNVMHAAPKGTILRVQDGKREPLCATVRFSHSDEAIHLAGVSGMKKDITEKSILKAIRLGIKEMKETGYFTFAERPRRKRVQPPQRKIKSDLPF